MLGSNNFLENTYGSEWGDDVPMQKVIALDEGEHEQSFEHNPSNEELGSPDNISLPKTIQVSPGRPAGTVPPDKKDIDMRSHKTL